MTEEYKSKYTGQEIDRRLEQVEINNNNITDMASQLTELSEEVENINPTPMISVTYAELVALRDNGELIAGMQYRITDYVTTTAQENTQSAGHQFDVIVTADNANTLNEVARACQHEGDTYFSEAGANLVAWQIWYSLDNDTDRFKWADTTNGKGVIYRMIDEWNNDCPYDFKNIQFKHPKDTITYPDYYYTFSTVIDSIVTDHSLLQGYCYSNTMKEHIMLKKQYLNENVFLNTSKFSNCYSNSFGNTCYYNTFSDNCNSNTFGNNCNGNSFGNNCGYNSFGNSCTANSFRVSASQTATLKDYVKYNHFDDGCSRNVIWNSDATLSGVLLKNINVNRGVCGEYGSHNMINIDVLNQNYEIEVYKDEGGNICVDTFPVPLTTNDIDLIWGQYFGGGGYGSGSASAIAAEKIINSIGVGDYDETEQ